MGAKNWKIGSYTEIKGPIYTSYTTEPKQGSDSMLLKTVMQVTVESRLYDSA